MEHYQTFFISNNIIISARIPTRELNNLLNDKNKDNPYSKDKFILMKIEIFKFVLKNRNYNKLAFTMPHQRKKDLTKRKSFTLTIMHVKNVLLNLNVRKQNIVQ